MEIPAVRPTLAAAHCVVIETGRSFGKGHDLASLRPTANATPPHRVTWCSDSGSPTGQWRGAATSGILAAPRIVLLGRLAAPSPPYATLDRPKRADQNSPDRRRRCPSKPSRKARFGRQTKGTMIVIPALAVLRANHVSTGGLPARARRQSGLARCILGARRGCTSLKRSLKHAFQPTIRCQ